MGVFLDKWKFLAISLYAIGTCVSEVEINFITEITETVTEEQDVFLQCKITGFQSHHIISWSKDDQQITYNSTVTDRGLRNREINSEFSFYIDTDILRSVGYSYIRFIPVKRYDSGTYACEVYAMEENADILATHQTISVDVVYVPSQDYPKCIPEGELFINIGQHLHLTCLSEIGNPRVNLTWKQSNTNNQFRNIKGVTSSGNGLLKSEFDILSLTLAEHNITFVCSMTSSTNQVLRTCYVRTQVVLPEPLVAILPRSGLAYIGESIDFTCSSYLALTNQKWSTEPNTLLGNMTVISENEHVLHISNVTVRDNGILILCRVLFRDDWIVATSILYVKERVSTTALSEVTTNNLNEAHSFTIGSSLVWMISFVVVSTAAGLGFIACYLLNRRKRNSNTNRKGVNQNEGAVPYAVTKIGGRERPYVRSIECITGQTGDSQHLQTIPAEISLDDNYVRENAGQDPTKMVLELENPAYMTQSNYINASNRPIVIRNMSHISHASTVEPDYMSVEM